MLLSTMVLGYVGVTSIFLYEDRSPEIFKKALTLIVISKTNLYILRSELRKIGNKTLPDQLMD